MSKFPKEFIWGAATSAYQIEGAWNEDNRTESLWDMICHDYGLKNGTGDVACDHYHRFNEDITLMKDMGLQAYRFSISWTRIIPEAGGPVNQKGIDFYNNLINSLIEAGIEPVATIYHFDAPKELELLGGWVRREMIEEFVRYSKICFDAFGDRVKKFITINEPYIMSAMYRRSAEMQKLNPAYAAYQSSHHMILAHSLAVEEYRVSKNGDGKIGYAPNLSMVYPLKDEPKMQKNAKLVDAFFNRFYLEPVLEGTYPEIVLNTLKDNGIILDIQENDMVVIKDNKSDFIGINNYSRLVVDEHFDSINFTLETMAMSDVNSKIEGAEYTEYGWEIYPDGMYDIIMHVSELYDYPEIYITENGMACKDTIVKNGQVIDDDRIAYMESYLRAIRKTIYDGADVKGYFAWSLMDNFEWSAGYSIKMGLIHVDFGTQKRTIKKSGDWFSNCIKNNRF